MTLREAEVSPVGAAVGLTVHGLTRSRPQLVPVSLCGMIIVLIAATILHIARGEVRDEAVTITGER